MEAIRENLKNINPFVAGAVGLVVGLLIGWFVIGWGLWPVKWVDASPADLQEVWRRDYLRMMIDSYTLLPDNEAAQRRWNELGSEAIQMLNAIAESPGMQSPAAIENFRQAVSAPPASEGKRE